MPKLKLKIKKKEVIEEIKQDTEQKINNDGELEEKNEEIKKTKKVEVKEIIEEEKVKEEIIPKQELMVDKKAVSIDSEDLHQRFGSGKKGFLNRKEKTYGAMTNNFTTKDKGKKFINEYKTLDDSYKKGNSFKRGLRTKGYLEEDDDSFRRSKKSVLFSKKVKEIEEIKQVLVDKTGKEVFLKEFLTVKEFSEKIGITLSKIIAEFMKNGMLVNLNTKVDFETCFIIAESFGVPVVKEEKESASIADIMDGNIVELLKDDDVFRKVSRPPIISIMGHVDHGKTSILDYIRKTSVAGEEAGGITQKIGAYQIEKDGKKITFIDTPGHEAFSLMRARGAKLTDIVVIVVAADEGVKPQTIESINHAKEASVPVIVAINKMDKVGANVDLVKGQLAEQGLQAEDWGGNVIMVPVSAHSGLGIDSLLEMIILVADMQELKADPKRHAVATVIESHLDTRLGPLATVLVNTGTLHKGDSILCASAFGKIRFIKDYKGKNIDDAEPSKPVLISGLNNVVEGGDILQAVSDIEIARNKAHEFQLLRASKSISDFEGASLEMLLNRIKTGNLKQLKVVLKAESNGSLEAIKDALLKLNTQEIKIHIIHSGVGDVNDSDVLMAGTSQALLIGYNVGTIGQAKNMLANSKIEFINKKVIYHIIEKVESIITGMIDVKHEDIDLGELKIKAIFFTSKDKMIIGCDVITGKVENRAKLRIIRNNKKVGSGEILNLKSGVTDAHEMLAGTECGIAFLGDIKPEIGDKIEAYKIVQRK
ncbi:translation initiation factor IF-2 [Candidatus Gracilibacteria bacterium]|nr:translation initiation factor IF-2 [Candidatus Gracilibacteria bacterium]